MEPSKSSVVELFRQPRQFVVPLYQRGYVWTLEKQIVPLWADIEDRVGKLLEESAIKAQQPNVSLRPVQAHFLGSVVLAKPADTIFGRVTAFEVIDGQQRTTTLHLLLLAFRHACVDLKLEQAAAFLAAFLRNPDTDPKHPEDAYKVWPTRAGRDEMELLNKAVTVGDVLKRYPANLARNATERPLMVQSFLYLYGACRHFLSGVELGGPEVEGEASTRSDALSKSSRGFSEAHLPRAAAEDAPHRAEHLFKALQQLMQMIVLTLDEKDDPQVIFETLNARGEPLLASDLIRNFVFLRAASLGENVDRLYSSYWQGFDQQQDGKGISANKYWREKQRQGRLTHPRIDLFFFHYTLLRCKEETKLTHVFSAFKEWWLSGPRDVENELTRIVEGSEQFRALLSPQGNDALAEFGRLVRGMDVASVTPVVLSLLERVDDLEQVSQALTDLGSYIVRRTVCGLTKKNFNRLFLQLIGVTQAAQDPVNALRDFLLDLKGESQYWPSDDEFEQKWLACRAYKELRAGRVLTILRALEYHQLSQEIRDRQLGDLDDLSIEHVLPQSWEKAGHYPLPTSPDAMARREAALHSFGNLALLTQSLNSRVSNGPFFVAATSSEKGPTGKRVEICRNSLLATNTYFHDRTSWSDADISVRNVALFKTALKVWPKPPGPQASAV